MAHGVHAWCVCMGPAGDGPSSHLSSPAPACFQVCSRLFIGKGNLQLKRMLIGQVEELRQNGYVVIENFISRELAQQIKLAVLLQYSKGEISRIED